MTDVLEAQLRELTGPVAIEPVSQGAEAVVYVTKVHPYLTTTDKSYIIKYRPPKPYRHEVLDAQLTKHRTLAEARILQKLRGSQVHAPNLIFVDPQHGLIWMECIEGKGLKQMIWDNEETGAELEATVVAVGREIGKLHLADIVHGDLTTSNIMIRQGSLEPVLIDFGLASQSAMAEDKAVDLYVLERAVESTHPIHSAKYNEWLLNGYMAVHNESKLGKQRIKEVMSRLEQVRQRGRKRSLVG